MIPSIITPAALGKQTFNEGWATFDHGPDQTAKDCHRWRTVLNGGSDVYSRHITGECYQADEQFVHRPGTLIMQCNKVPAEKQAGVWGKKYAGAGINTKFSFSQLFGYFETLCRLPKGKGAYSAWWLLPTVGAWPKNGESDIFETTGDPRFIYCTVHSPTLKGGQMQKKVALGFDGSASVHSYGIAWSADELVWFVDRKEVFRTATPADMKAVPMFMLLTLGASHPWDNDRPDASTPWPIQMPVYGVRAWELG